jgi:hypothetical protein
MKLFAHIRSDGAIQGLVVAPDGDRSAGVNAEPSVQVSEIQNHGFTKEVTPEQLAQILETKSVALTPAQGKLVARKK